MRMRDFPGCVADALAKQLLGWLHRRVDPESREWLDALTAESDCAADGWQRLRWALGGVPLVWTINRRCKMDEPERGTMEAPIASGVSNIAAVAGWYAVIIPATYGAARIFRCQLFFGSQPGGCQEHPFAFGSIVIGGGVLGMMTAFALRARFAAYWWALFSVINTVGFIWFLSSGVVDVPRYGATQGAMFMAATFGMVLAAIARQIPQTESENRITAQLVAGAISFVIADALIRIRDRQLVADNVNHLAVFACAMSAAILAAMIGRHWSRHTVTPADRRA
jgi:hypothetical protein